MHTIAQLQTLLYGQSDSRDATATTTTTTTNAPYPDEIYQHHVNQLLPSLIQRDLDDPAAINSLCQQAIKLEAEHKPHLYSIRLIVLDFLCRQLQPNASLLNWALCFIGQQQQEQEQFRLTVLADSCSSFVALRQQIFHQCFQLRETEAYRDLQTHRLLYDLLDDLRMPSCAWLLEIEASLHMQYQSCLQQCEQILENQATRPSLCIVHGQQFVESIPPSTVAKSVSIQMRLALYGGLQPAEMAPLLRYLAQMKTWEGRECFQLSETFTRAIIRGCPAPLLTLLNSEIDGMTKQFFADPKLKALCLDETLLKELSQDNCNIPFNMNLMNECFQILGSAPPPRFMAQITLLTISLMQTFPQFHHNQDITWDECCRLCDSAWAHAFASLLDRAMFETRPASESTSIRSLARLCFCCMLFHATVSATATKKKDTESIATVRQEERIKLWQRYSENRILFLNSFEDTQHKQKQLARDLAMVQRLLFTL
ncbi:hypothetical protein BDB00DRAFT_796315 [Zychaea mexicana]|uniref:uncharacterized protein n=1 Tax=Zychaea mexicana TaxID=64656 RepID=UPI0022FEC582|nr:uncharacterized protein BDB00DRAFT_796315 [Zychaea mexicana]KAI9499318.1 hypothetical protein BDB00DRAFT_796315 [Zychaea mexicana]